MVIIDDYEALDLMLERLQKLGVKEKSPEWELWAEMYDNYIHGGEFASLESPLELDLVNEDYLKNCQILNKENCSNIKNILEEADEGEVDFVDEKLGKFRAEAYDPDAEIVLIRFNSYLE